MKSHLAICSESASIDSASNALSIFNIYEEFQAQTFPFIIPKLTTVFVLLKEDKDEGVIPAEINFELNGNLVFKQPLSIDFQNVLRSRQVLSVFGFAVISPGVLSASLEVNNEVVAKWDIPVKQMVMSQQVLKQPNSGGST